MQIQKEKCLLEMEDIPNSVKDDVPCFLPGPLKCEMPW